MVREIMEELNNVSGPRVDRAEFKTDLEATLYKHLKAVLEKSEMPFTGDNLLNLEDFMVEKKAGVNRFVNAISQLVDDYVESLRKSNSEEEVEDGSQEEADFN